MSLDLPTEVSFKQTMSIKHEGNRIYLGLGRSRDCGNFWRTVSSSLSTEQCTLDFTENKPSNSRQSTNNTYNKPNK